MNLKFSPRGATTEANKMIPPELQLQLFRLVDSQIELGLKMDDWQFFDLHRLDANRIRIIHRQCNPTRHEEHVLEGFALSISELEAWILHYDHLGSTLMIADNYDQTNPDNDISN